jgi:hypothetical protein
MVSKAPKFGNKAINYALSGNTTQDCGLGIRVIKLHSIKFRVRFATALNAPN